jgi:hypothetical protein
MGSEKVLLPILWMSPEHIYEIGRREVEGVGKTRERERDKLLPVKLVSKNSCYQ